MGDAPSVARSVRAALFSRSSSFLWGVQDVDYLSKIAGCFVDSPPVLRAYRVVPQFPKERNRQNLTQEGEKFYLLREHFPSCRPSFGHKSLTGRSSGLDCLSDADSSVTNGIPQPPSLLYRRRLFYLGDRTSRYFMNREPPDSSPDVHSTAANARLADYCSCSLGAQRAGHALVERTRRSNGKRE